MERDHQKLAQKTMCTGAECSSGSGYDGKTQPGDSIPRTYRLDSVGAKRVTAARGHLLDPVAYAQSVAHVYGIHVPDEEGLG